MKRCALLLLLLASALSAGCHHAGTAPPGWWSSPYVAEDASGPASTNNQIPATFSGYGPGGRLQVFICYGTVLSNHTALRLEAPGVQTLMWDPGGTYKQDDPAYARRYDVLTRNAPSVDQWWHYRRESCNEPVMEMFEWSISDDQAKRLHAILLTRHDPADASQVFEPDASGLECCKRVSEFLSRFTDGRPDVPVSYFWPHKLGERLWTQQPHRVIIFRKDGQDTAYQRPPGSPRDD